MQNKWAAAWRRARRYLHFHYSTTEKVNGSFHFLSTPSSALGEIKTAALCASDRDDIVSGGPATLSSGGRLTVLYGRSR